MFRFFRIPTEDGDIYLELDFFVVISIILNFFYLIFFLTWVTWSLSFAIGTREIEKIYISMFPDKLPYCYRYKKQLFPSLVAYCILRIWEKGLEN